MPTNQFLDSFADANEEYGSFDLAVECATENVYNYSVQNERMCISDVPFDF